MIRWVRVGAFEEMTFQYLVEGPGGDEQRSRTKMMSSDWQ